MGQYDSGGMRKKRSPLGWWTAAAGVLFCIGLTILLLITVVRGSGDTTASVGSSGVQMSIMDKFDMVVGNAVSDALDGVLTIDKVYFLSEDTMAAPKPNPTQVGEASDPAELQDLLADATERLNINHMVFSTKTPVLPGSKIRYYLDDTIFSVSWKQAVDECIYSFAEVKVGHPSQFRRFMSGGEYGSGVLYTASEMAASVNAVTASSADYYAYRPQGCIVYNGNVCKVHGNYLDVCFIDDKGDMLFERAKSPRIKNKDTVAEYVKENNIRFSLTFGPVLIENGENVCPGYYQLGELGGRYSRAALCQQEALHYIVVTANTEEGHMIMPTVPELAQNLQAMGVQKAYALDGGQTATLIANNEIVNSISYGSERKISDIIYFATAMPAQE